MSAQSSWPAPLVKICGIRSTHVAVGAAKAGADFLGFNFARVSKRYVDAAVARIAILALRRENRSSVVGIFVNQSVEEVASISRTCDLDYVQLSGAESPDYCRAVTDLTGLPVIKAIRLGVPAEAMQVQLFPSLGGVNLLLADAAVVGSWGGAGETWDWRQAADLAAQHPLLLAGGLTPSNVASTIEIVSPLGVDVATGVETEGQTDLDKVRAFIRSVRIAPAAAVPLTQAAGQ